MAPETFPSFAVGCPAFDLRRSIEWLEREVEVDETLAQAGEEDA